MTVPERKQRPMLRRDDPRVQAATRALEAFQDEEEQPWLIAAFLVEIVLNVDHNMRLRRRNDSVPWSVKL